MYTVWQVVSFFLERFAQENTTMAAIAGAGGFGGGGFGGGGRGRGANVGGWVGMERMLLRERADLSGQLRGLALLTPLLVSVQYKIFMQFR
jgi:hypothetical protein